MFDNPINDRVFAPIMLVLGVVILVRTLSAGGGVLSLGMLFGVLFVAVGALRLISAGQRRRHDG